MRRTIRFVARSSSARFVRYAAALGALGGLLFASQILETYAASLTSYLAGKTPIQDARPLQQQRGVNLDGSLRRASTHPLSLAGNPFENVWRGEAELNDVRLDTGTYSPSLVDISLPATVPWVIGRSFNSRQDNSGQYDSDGLQGINWFQSSQPELVAYVDAGNHANDVLYLVYGADRYVEFNRTGANDDTYKSKNGAAGVFLRTGGSPDVFAYYAPDGMVATFFGFNTSDPNYKGQIWKVANPNGDVAYVGSTSSATSAISGGYDSDGRITTAFDSAGREFDYTYSASTIGGKKRLESVIVTASAVEVARVEYAYYPDSPSPTYGDPGDLRTVKVTLPLTDSGISDVRTTYYRYYENSYNAVTNRGYPHAIMLVLEPEGARQYDYTGAADATFDDDFIGETTANLKEYSAAYFEYDASRRIDVAFFNGRCGCGSAGSGTFAFSYGTNSSYVNNSGYDTAWCRRTVVDQPDSGWVTQYFDEVGQPLARIMSDGDPSGSPTFWPTRVTRNSAGCVTHVGTPASVASYSHSSGAIGNATTGLVHVYVREPSGDLTGFLDDEMWRDGSASAPPPENAEHYLKSFVWWTSKSTKTIGGLTLVRPLIKQVWDYPNAGSSQYDTDVNEAAFDYTTYSGSSQPLALATMERTDPDVSNTHNGDTGSGLVTKTHYKLDGQVDFTAIDNDTEVVIHYRAYTNGQVVDAREDAQTSGLSAPSGDFDDDGSTPANDTRTTAYDSQGRVTSITEPGGRVMKTYYSRLKDRRLVTIQFPRYASSTYYGPATYMVTNHAGKVEASGVIALDGGDSTAAVTTFIDETDEDAITAVDTDTSAPYDFGQVAQLRTYQYDKAGTQLQSERVYYAIPATSPGVDGTNYDETDYGYDEMGRRRRTKEAHGTIIRLVYDARGQITEHWIGTNDHSFAGGANSGPDNMVQIEATAFDVNGYTTTKTRYIQDSTTGQRVTIYTNDLRGRPVVVENPTAPHSLTLFDNEGRAIAVGQYSSTSGLDADSNPTDGVYFASNRLALNETAYDERGRVWKTARHSIDAGDGSDDDSLESLTWYDRVSRVAARDGEQLEKFQYDRLNRQVRRWVLAYVDAAEDTWAEAIDGVTDDVIMEEHETGYDVEGHALLQVDLSRAWAATGSSPRDGALDANGDNDFAVFDDAGIQTQTIAGATKPIARAQITASWYDAWDRLSDVVQYGTNHASDNIADFDRPAASSPPSRSDTELRTTCEYNYDGTLKQTTDPRGLVTRNEYDAEGRMIKAIANYADGTPGGGTHDDEDQTILYTYTDGLQTAITVDLPYPQTDQTTTYFYGTTKGSSGPDSKIATGHLLRKVQYPDSASSTWDIVAYAYNAQSQETWQRDQATDSGHQSDYNTIETDYDGAGRQLSRSVTQKRSITDGAVLRIETGYDDLGRTETVTQYSDPAGGGAYLIDQVKYEHDGWGDITDFKQDIDSAVGGSGYWDVSYTYAKATSGRNTIRRSGMTIPGGTTYEFQYRASSTAFDDQASRVTSIRDAFATPLATYQYNGVGQVVRTYLDEPELYSKLYSAGVSFSGLDRFDRTIVSRWTKDLATDRDIYHVALSYDRDSNITLQDDDMHAGHDVAYINDNLNRLVDAEEGTWGGSSISSRTRHQIWTLNQTGNWNEDKVDLDGDDNFSEAGEWDDTRTHNDVNELSTRDMDSTPGTAGNNYTFAYDAAGNMTDDGESYKYEWDAFYRLRKVKNQSNQLVSEYWYNGLGHLITRHQDTDTDGDVDGSDKYFHSAYDERWRCVATFRDSDSDPKEQFLYHAAGAGGYGGSSYIDAVVVRDRDMTNGWTGSADGVLEERTYYAQNWHADVVAVVGFNGSAYMVEWAKYSAYGIPFGLPFGDANSDGETDSADDTIINGWISGSYDVRGDIDLDGDVDHTDYAAVHANHQRLGRGTLTAASVGNRLGFGGYVFDANAASEYIIRHRVLSPEKGRWLQRDPLGYADSLSLYQYTLGAPQTYLDPDGTCVLSDWQSTIGGWLKKLWWCSDSFRERMKDCFGAQSPDDLAGNKDDTKRYGPWTENDRWLQDIEAAGGKEVHHGITEGNYYTTSGGYGFPLGSSITRIDLDYFKNDNGPNGGAALLGHELLHQCQIQNGPAAGRSRQEREAAEKANEAAARDFEARVRRELDRCDDPTQCWFPYIDRYRTRRHGPGLVPPTPANPITTGT